MVAVTGKQNLYNLKLLKTFLTHFNTVGENIIASTKIQNNLNDYSG